MRICLPLLSLIFRALEKRNEPVRFLPNFWKSVNIGWYQRQGHLREVAEKDFFKYPDPLLSCRPAAAIIGPDGKKVTIPSFYQKNEIFMNNLKKSAL